MLGHDVEPQLLKVNVPDVIQAPGLPPLNHSQTSAIRSVLQRPLSLIQGLCVCGGSNHESYSGCFFCFLFANFQVLLALAKL